MQYLFKHKELTHWFLHGPFNHCDVLLSVFMEQNLKCHLVTETSVTSGCWKSSLCTEIIPRASENSEISLEMKM